MALTTVISKFQLNNGLSPEETIADVQKTIPVYQGQDGFIRKYICLNFDEGWGQGIYLWDDRAKAEAFYARVRHMIREQTGSEPEITFMDTYLVVDKPAGTVEVYEV